MTSRETCQAPIQGDLASVPQKLQRSFDLDDRSFLLGRHGRHSGDIPNLRLHSIHAAGGVEPLAENVVMGAFEDSSLLGQAECAHSKVVHISIKGNCLEIGNPGDDSFSSVPIALSEVHRSTKLPVLRVKQHADTGMASLNLSTKIQPVEVMDIRENSYICRWCLSRGNQGICCRISEPTSSSTEHWLCPKCAGQGVPRDTWLIEVIGAGDELEADMQTVLAALAGAGAMRTDLDTSFEIAPEELGSGSNAVVHRVVPKRSVVSEGCCGAEEGAVVKLFKSEPNSVHNTFETIAQEALALAAVQEHPNIIGFCGFFYVGTVHESRPNYAPYALMMELCSGGSLFDLAASGCPRWPEEEAKGVMRDLLSGLSHVHAAGFVHRDVKMENIMIAHDGRAMLADFGLACHVSNSKEMQRKCGSPGYCAPEVIKDQPYDQKVDIFASGVVLYSLLFARLPFHGSNASRTLHKTLQGRFSIDVAPGQKPLGKRATALLCRFLCKLPDERPDATQALVHSWFRPKQAADKFAAPCGTISRSASSSTQESSEEELFNSSCCADTTATMPSPKGRSTSPLKRRELVSTIGATSALCAASGSSNLATDQQTPRVRGFCTDSTGMQEQRTTGQSGGSDGSNRCGQSSSLAVAEDACLFESESTTCTRTDSDRWAARRPSGKGKSQSPLKRRGLVESFRTALLPQAASDLPSIGDVISSQQSPRNASVHEHEADTQQERKAWRRPLSRARRRADSDCLDEVSVPAPPSGKMIIAAPRLRMLSRFRNTPGGC